jgi:hypothetical protein
MWKGLDYHYSKMVLKAIAAFYGQDTIYTVLDRIVARDPCSVTEYKADFDRALNQIGRCKDWGNQDIEDVKWKECRKYGIWQQLVIADCIGATDEDVRRMRLPEDQIPKLTGQAYGAMARFLNGNS